MSDAQIKIKAKDDTAKAFKTAEAGLKKIGDVAGSVQTQIAGLIGAAGFAALIEMNLDTAASAKKLSDSIGVNVEDLTSWQYAVRGTQVSGEKMGDILKDVAEKIGDAFASGGGEAIDVLERLNLNVDEMVRLTPDQQLLKIAGALDQVADHNEKVFLLESLASDASYLLPLLDDNAAKFRDLRAEGEQLGAVISNESAAAAEKFQDDLEKLKASGNSLALELGTKALPALNNITTAMLEAAKDSGVLMALWVGLGGAASELLGLEGSAADMAEKAADARARQTRELRRLTEGVISNTTVMEVSEKRVMALREQIEYLNEHGYGPATIQGKAVATQLAVEEESYRKSAEAVKTYTAELDAFKEKNKPAEVAEKVGPTVQRGTSAEDEKRQAELQKLRDQQQEKVALMIEGWAGEMELTYIHEAEKKAFIDQALANEAITKQQHQTALTLIEQEGAEKRQKITEAEAKARRSIYSGMMSNLTSLMASGSKTQFEIGKRASQAGALLSARESITHSFNAGAKIGGPVLGAAFAVTAGIATAQQIAQLESTTFSGGGSISPAGGGGVSAGGGQPPVAPVPPALSASQQQASPQISITVAGNIVGVDGMSQLVEEQVYPALKTLIEQRDFAPVG